MDLSTLSTFEMANLIGAYYKLGSKPRIDPHLLARGYTPEQIAALDKSIITKQNNINCCGIKITGDLDQFNEPSLNFYLPAFHSFDEKGINPFPGSYSEQPSKIIDIFDILAQIKLDETQKIQREHEREMNRKKK